MSVSTHGAVGGGVGVNIRSAGEERIRLPARVKRHSLYQRAVQFVKCGGFKRTKVDLTGMAGA